jgi:hypothetical protein
VPSRVPMDALPPGGGDNGSGGRGSGAAGAKQQAAQVREARTPHAGSQQHS